MVLRGASVTAPGAPLVTSADGRVDLDGDVASTSGITASVAGGTVTLTGSVPLATARRRHRDRPPAPEPGDTEIRLVWSGVQAGALQEAFRPDKPATVSAILSGEARLDGNVGSIERVRGEVVIPRTAVRIQGLELQLEPLTVTLDAGRMTTRGLAVTSEAGTFRADGEVDLRARTVDAEGHGQMELRTLSPFLEEASLTGSAQVDLALQGPLDAPRMNGTVQVTDGTMRVREFPQALTGVRASLTLDGHTVRVSDTSGILGGGTLNVGGTAQVSGLKLTDVSLTLAGKDMGLRYPVGGIHRRSGRLADIKTRLDADLTFTGRPGDYMLAGEVKVLRGLYDADIFPGEALLAPETPPAPDDGPSAFQRSVALNVTMATENPFYVRNNLAQLEATGTWRVRGDLDEPAPFGRLEINPGGKVFLQERELTVTSGGLVYNGTMDPDLDVRAETLIPRVDEPDIEVMVAAQGTLDFPQLRLSSSPPRSEKELASLITTGRPDVGLNSGAWIVGEQAATLLTGPFTREISRSLRELGFDQVNIQPELLAREDDPGARFTVGKEFSHYVKLVYSLGLNTPEAQYYAALFRFRAGGEVTLKALRKSDGTVTYGAGQRLRFGGPPRPERPQGLRGGRAARGRAAARCGRAPPGARGGPARVTAPGLDQGQAGEEDDVLGAAERRGPVAREARGGGAPGGHRGAAAGGRRGHLHRPARRAPFLAREGYGGPARPRPRDKEGPLRRGSTRARTRAAPRRAADPRPLESGGGGARRHRGRPARAACSPSPPDRASPWPSCPFPGATALSASKLTEAAGGPAAFLVSPKEAERAIRDLYRTELYLLAEVGPTAVAEAGGQVRIVVPVKEGPPAVVREVRLEGASLPGADLEPLLQIEPGTSYDRVAVNNAVLRVRDHYLKLGYPAVRVVPRLEPEGADLNVVLRVVEGEPVVAGPISITGLKRTRASLVRRQINIQPGEPLDPRKLAELERRLLDLGIFSRAVVTAASESPAPITIELEEDAPYKVAYDFRYNEAEGFSALVDGELGNLFGTGVALGGRYRFGQRVRDERASLHIPSIGYGDLTASVFHTWQELVVLEEESPGAVGMPNERTTERGFLIQQARHRHPYDFLYGYRLKRVTETFDLLTGAPRQSDIGALDGSLVRDTRENPLNAHRGTFLSLNLVYGPEALAPTPPSARPSPRPSSCGPWASG